MYRTLVLSGFLGILCAVAVVAGEYKDARVTKVDKGKDKTTVTFTYKNDKGDEVTKTLPASDKASYWGLKKGEKFEYTDTEKLFAAINDKGRSAQVITTDKDDKEITSILFGKGKGGTAPE